MKIEFQITEVPDIRVPVISFKLSHTKRGVGREKKNLFQLSEVPLKRVPDKRIGLYTSNHTMTFVMPIVT